jgi:hypothetical protein
MQSFRAGARLIWPLRLGAGLLLLKQHLTGAEVTVAGPARNEDWIEVD